MKKILVIEDNADMRSNISEMLELANYDVSTAENGKLGVEMALQLKPDLIICDIVMPVLDGYGVLNVLHNNNGFQNTPFIFLSGSSEMGAFRKGMNMGADDYISKPFDGTELLSAVESRLRKVLKRQDELLPEPAEQCSGGDHLNEVLSGFRENRKLNKYKKKQIIYAEGNRPSRLYYLQKGKVKTYKSNDDGKQLIVDLYKEGEFVGYSSLIEGTAYRETAEAMEDCQLAIIPRDEFEELMNSNLCAARWFSALVAAKLGEKDSQLLGFAYNSLRKKVADALLSFHKKYHGIINISRHSLATLAGTATESLIRTLAEFKNERLIDIREHQVVILDEKKLANLLN